MRTTVLDIETIPDRAAAERAGIDLSAGFPAWPIHELACVSLLHVARGADWKPEFRIESFTRADLTERGIIASVERSIEGAFEVVTFNGRSFDVPVLMARAALARERCPTIVKLMAQPRTKPGLHVDLLEEVTGYGAAMRVKLSDFCSAFGIPVKLQAHGGDVAELAASGEWDSIARYCEEDVAATWLALRLWRAAQRDEPDAADDAWAGLAAWITADQPRLEHLLAFAGNLDCPRGGRVLGEHHLAQITF